MGETATQDFQRIVHACRQAFIGVGIFSAAISLLMLAVPIYMLQIYDRVLSTRSIDTLLALSFMVVTAVFVLGVLDAVRGRMMTRIGIWLDRELAGDMLSSGVRQSLSGDDAGRGQGLRDLASLRNYIAGSGLLPLFDAPFLFVFLAVIFLIHPVLGWVTAAGAIILFLLALANELATRNLIRDANNETMHALNEADIAIRNADVIEAMGLLPSLRRRWQAASSIYLTQQRQANDRAGAITASARFVRLVVQIAILATGAFLVIGGQLTGGAMIAAAIIGTRALAPVEQSIQGWKAFVTAHGAYRRVKHLATATAAVTSPMTLPAPQGQLTVQGLISIPEGSPTPILRDINFDLEPGMALGLTGPSAAGKTTLARHLVGSLKPTRGHVRLDGADLAVWDAADRGRHIGYLPQDVELFTGTVRENIARMDEASDDDIVAAAQLAGVHEMVLSLPKGYDTRISDGGAVLSGGQRQRIALARAVFGRPKLIVLDEPNSNLDAPGEHALIATLDQLRAAGATVILIAHRPNIMSRMDKILVLRDGAVDQFGERDDVLQRLRGPVAVSSEPSPDQAAPISAANPKADP